MHTNISRRLTRRGFLAKSFAAAGTLFVPSAASANRIASATKRAARSWKALATDFKFKGQILVPADADFNRFVYGELWNKLVPDRTPDVVVRVVDEQDVVAAIKFARANKLKVCVRGGGHNWVAPSIRNGGMMLDLSNLNQVISIDPEARKAVVQPVISNRDMAAYLGTYGMAYPVGHCPTVKLSGYLLSGGLSWNQGEWGPGIGSVEAIELFTPQGELITASEDQNTDYFWAARGAAYGFFAVAVRYHLKLYPLPKAMTASVYVYPYENLIDVAEWLDALAPKLPRNVELTLFLVQAPHELVNQANASNGKVCKLAATAFAHTPEQGKSALSLLETCPVIEKCLSKSVAQPTSFSETFDASSALWQPGLRSKVDAMFSNAPLSDLCRSIRDHCLTLYPKTVVLFNLFGGTDGAAPPPDAAFSQTAKIYGGPWTMWDSAADDAAQIAWHEECVKSLKPYMVGHYVSESDTIAHPEYLKGAYTPEKFARLAELRKKYDPDGIFFSYFEGLSL